MSESDLSSRVLAAFLVRLAADREAGAVRPLREYQRSFPGHDAELEREYRAWIEGAAEGAERELGPYRVERELGRGGQAGVFLATDTRIGRRVALKVLHAWFGAAHAGAARFRREAELLGRLDHPDVCAIYDVALDAEPPYLAMRYVEGRTLAAEIARARERGGKTVLEEDGLDGLLRYFARAARALHAAHECGLVHRDVKPGNLMITAERAPVLLDFGLAADREGGIDLTRSDQVVGTPAYLAPELIDGTASGDAPADVYALGVTLHEALTLCAPFDAPTRDGVYHGILRGELPDVRRARRDLPRDLAVVVATATAREPARRYRSAAQLADDLDRVAERRSIAARPPGPFARAAGVARRHPLPAAAIAVAFLALAAGLAATLHALGVAEAERDQKEHTLRELDAVLELADGQVLAALRDEATRLRFVAGETGAPEWLARARALLATRPTHAERRAAIAARATAPGERFASNADRWRHAALTRLLDDLDAFSGEVADVDTRWAAVLDSERELRGARAGAWRRAIAAIAASPRYRGLRLRAAPDLVPLGPDPASGLHEFALPPTGAVPDRDEHGALRLADDSAVVFVLLPGGRATIGATATPGPHHDPAAAADEGPVHEVDLDPFLLAKHELTQAQFRRLTNREPSYFRAGERIDGRLVTARHPVEWVPWGEASAALARYGLLLPTEAQWEYAARAGSHTVFAGGDGVSALDGAANLLDAAGHRAGVNDEAEATRSVDDGWARHAPVGSFRPNAFGLHDMQGNVVEWCRDAYHGYDVPARPGDGLRGGDGELHVLRGGSFHHPAAGLRCARRSASGEFWGLNVGFRAARAADLE